MRDITVQQAIYQRRSTRFFDSSRSIPQETLEYILQAGLRAPSPKNRQPWVFTVIMDETHRQEIAQTLERSLRQLERQRLASGTGIDDLELAQGSVQVLRQAPVLLLVGYEHDDKNNHRDAHEWPLTALPFEVIDIQAIGAAVQNILLAATAQGIDSLWIGDILYAYQEIMRLLTLQNPVVAAVALGYGMCYQTPRAGLNEKVSYW